LRILVLAQCYSPEDVSAAILISELATDLVKHGHEVTVVTGAPSYPQGRVFQGYRNRIHAVEWIDGVRVVRVWSHISPEKSFWPRILHYGTYSATAFYGGLFSGKPDVLVSYSPPLPLGISAWALSRIWGIPWTLEVEDLYPDAAVAIGALTNRRIISFFSAMERFIYRHASRIILISEAFRRNLLAKGVPNEKLAVIPVWADPDVVFPMPKENAFRARNALEGKFVVMYAGNIGLTSCLEDVLAAAAILRDEADIRFVIVGEGVKKDDLRAAAREQGLRNLLFLPFEPREGLSEMMAAADVNLVTLNPGSAQTSMPCKIFNIMASARPIVAVTPPGSEIARLVEEGDCGVNVPAERPERLAQAILEMKAQPERSREMGNNGRSRLEKRYSRAHCVAQTEEVLQGLQRKKR
jgi:colanic acid biosynthesis glycosyl transferase WcaI